jgi:hypothetical protein
MLGSYTKVLDFEDFNNLFHEGQNALSLMLQKSTFFPNTTKSGIFFEFLNGRWKMTKCICGLNLK